MPFEIVRQDITKMEVDAIVNAANTDLARGGGVCGLIFKAAGIKEMEEACQKLGPISVGEAAMTPGFNLPSKFVIHAAGPVYRKHELKESERLLRLTYLSSLKLAKETGMNNVAFPLISSGIYGYPKDEALKVATSVIKGFLAHNEMDVYLVVYDKKSFVISQDLLGEVKSYLDENYVSVNRRFRRDLLDVELVTLKSAEPMSLEAESPFDEEGLDELIGKLDEPFNTTLLRLIDLKGKSDVEVYKGANISRKLFSKIRSGNGYMPSKRTIIALAISLELNLRETSDLLRCAGYALSNSQKFDVIVEFFITNGKYDIFEINEVLFAYDQPLIGA